MRLIDADALKANINTAFWSNIEKIIDSAPPIDAVSVVRGEWKDQLNYRDGSYYNVCSECGYFDDERDDLTAYNFCPYCGAKMKGADDE